MVKAGLLVAALAACLSGCGERGQDRAATPSAGPAPTLSFQDVMLSEIDANADAIWEAGRVVSDETGDHDFLPKTPEEWAELRNAAVGLTEGPNLIVMEGREVVAPGAKVTGGGEYGTSTAEQVAAALKADRPLLLTYARTLQEAGAKAVLAVDARDPEALRAVGAEIDLACEACHQHFYYPGAVAAQTK